MTKSDRLCGRPRKRRRPPRTHVYLVSRSADGDLRHAEMLHASLDPRRAVNLMLDEARELLGSYLSAGMELSAPDHTPLHRYVAQGGTTFVRPAFLGRDVGPVNKKFEKAVSLTLKAAASPCREVSDSRLTYYTGVELPLRVDGHHARPLVYVEAVPLS